MELIKLSNILVATELQLDCSGSHTHDQEPPPGTVIIFPISEQELIGKVSEEELEIFKSVQDLHHQLEVT